MKKEVLFLLFILLGFFAKAQDLYFPPSFSQEWETTNPSDLGWCEDKIEETNVFLEETNTNAFIILKDGKVVVESYFNDFDLTSNWYWASAGKSLTSFLTGVLQQEGVIDINNPTSDYLGKGWTSCSEEDEEKITIKHQLTMTTGFDYTLEDSDCLDPECLICLNEPGEEWYYHNAPYTNISYALEAATGQGYTQLTNSKVVNKIGFIGLWTSTDNLRVFFSTARGMARFGLLMLNKGNWDGEQILDDEEYFNAMITPSQDINEAYGYLWWLNGQESFRLPSSIITFQGKLMPNAPDDLYAAVGKNGQIAMVVPSQNLVVVRMGNNPDSSLVPINYLRDLWDQVEQIKCTTSVVESRTIGFDIYPKLALNRIFIELENIDVLNFTAEVFDTRGNKLISSKSSVLETGELARGMYFVKITSENKVGVRKFFKI